MRQRSLFIYVIAFVAMCSVSGFAQDSNPAQLSPDYQKWLAEDVHWIIKSPEQNAFLKLTSNPERDQFVSQFWERRNPHPGSNENLFKQEHYRRLAFSNEHFAAGVAGDRTDRGRIYVIFGPPDSIVKHAAKSTSPADEIWEYRRIPGKSDNVSFKFLDRCACGKFELDSDLLRN
jgi:GWxTD domain-containing protein